MVLVGRRDSYHSIQFNYSKASFARGGPPSFRSHLLGFLWRYIRFPWRQNHGNAHFWPITNSTIFWAGEVSSPLWVQILYTVRTPLGTGQIVYVNTSWSAENPRTKMDLIGLGKWPKTCGFVMSLLCPDKQLDTSLDFLKRLRPTLSTRQPEEKTCAKHHDHRVFSQSCLRFRNPKSTGKNCTTKLFPDWLSLCLWSGSSKHTHTHISSTGHQQSHLKMQMNTS